MRSAILSDTRAAAAVTARRHGIPPSMIESVARRRLLGDWRGACAAADVDARVNPDTVRRRFGAATAAAVRDDLAALAPDLLRWHLPRHGSGTGRLRPGSLVPVAEYAEAGLVLAAATPESGLAAGERIVLLLLERTGTGRFDDSDPVTRAVLGAARWGVAERWSLVHGRMFWDAEAAGTLSGLCDQSPDDFEVTAAQDAGDPVRAWELAGFVVLGASAAGPDSAGPAAPAHPAADAAPVLPWPAATATEPMSPAIGRWFAALPVRLPGLVDRIRAVLPAADQAAIRSGTAAVLLSGLRSAGRVRVRAVPTRQALHVPTVPFPVWARPLDADLLRLGRLRASELHPLVGSVLAPGAGPLASASWGYHTVPFLAGTEGAVLRIECGTEVHSVVQDDGDWLALDHPDPVAARRESLLARLGGPVNPCLQAVRYLAAGRHVIDVVGELLDHGRVDDVRRLLRRHAGSTALSGIELGGGRTVAEVLDDLHDNTLRHRMMLAAAIREPGHHPLAPAHPHFGRTRKGRPIRPTTR